MLDIISMESLQRENVRDICGCLRIHKYGKDVRLQTLVVAPRDASF